MGAIFLVCGAGGPQLKRNPLGGTNDIHSDSLSTMTPLRFWKPTRIARLWISAVLVQAALYGAAYVADARHQAQRHAQDSVFRNATPMPDSLRRAISAFMRDSLGIWTERRGSTVTVHMPPELENSFKAALDSLGKGLRGALPILVVAFAVFHLPLLLAFILTLIWLLLRKSIPSEGSQGAA